MSIETHWGNKCNLENFHVFFYLFQTIGDCFCPCGKNFQHSCQNCFRRANWHTLRKTIFSEQNFVGLMAKHFWLLAMFFPAGLTKFSSTCPRKQFEGFFSSEKNIKCWPFRTLIEKILGFWEKLSGQFCQNCFLRVHRNISVINVLFEKLWFYLHLLGHWAKEFHHYGKIFWPSGYTVSAGLSKFPSTCPRKQIGGKIFRRKEIHFADVFGHGLKKFGTSFEPFWRRFSKLTSLWTEVHFEHKGNLRKVFFITFGNWEKNFRLLVEKFFDPIFKKTFY